MTFPSPRPLCVALGAFAASVLAVTSVGQINVPGAGHERVVSAEIKLAGHNSAFVTGRYPPPPPKRA